MNINNRASVSYNLSSFSSEVALWEKWKEIGKNDILFSEMNLAEIYDLFRQA